MLHNTTTPARAVLEAVRTAIALHQESDRPMDAFRCKMHMRRIMLAAMSAADPEYAEALEALIEFERSTDDTDSAIALSAAAGSLQVMADEYEACAERGPDLEAKHIAEETAAYRHSVGVYG